MLHRFQKLDGFLSRLPWMWRWTPVVRLYIFVCVLVICLVTPLVIMMQPTLADELEYFYGNWCIEQMKINGRDTVPISLGITVQFRDDGHCLGNMSMDYSHIRFPGLNTYSGSAEWVVVDDKLVVEKANENAKMFEGKYAVDIRGEVITLTSESVYIRAHVIKFRFPF